jgi:hypothetical protein
VGFVFACVVLGFVFVTQNPEFHLAVFPYIVILAALFSLYCYLQEMERLGDAFLGSKRRWATVR